MPATVTIAVTPVNDAPVAVNDTYEAIEGQELIVAVPGVLENDSDPEGNNLTATQIGTPPPGTLNLNSDGSFTYTPFGAAGAVALIYRFGQSMGEIKTDIKYMKKDVFFLKKDMVEVKTELKDFRKDYDFHIAQHHS